MKDNYRDTLDRLAFSQEQKQAMKAGLLAAAQAGQSRTPRRKWGRVIAAAAAAVTSFSISATMVCVLLVICVLMQYAVNTFND